MYDFGAWLLKCFFVVVIIVPYYIKLLKITFEIAESSYLSNLSLSEYFLRYRQLSLSLISYSKTSI